MGGPAYAPALGGVIGGSRFRYRRRMTAPPHALRHSPPLVALLIAIAAGLAAGCTSSSAIRLDRRGFTALDDTLPRVLVVVAHPDDELVATGALYLHGARRGGVADVLTITDGQGGFKYATFAEAMYGLELTREEVGRRELPEIRRREQQQSLELLGARMLLRLRQMDHRYSQDRFEVLDEAAGVWDLTSVREDLFARLESGGYDFVITLCPTPDTHGHHQAATVLALEAAARLAESERPVVLCCRVLTEGDAAGDSPPRLIEDEPLVRLRSARGPFSIDRTRPFGHRDRLTLKSIASVAVARHVSQGTMLGFIGRGDLEQYWIFDVSPPDAGARTAAWFATLEDPGFPKRSYGTTAGTNAAGVDPAAAPPAQPAGTSGVRR